MLADAVARRIAPSRLVLMIVVSVRILYCIKQFIIVVLWKLICMRVNIYRLIATNNGELQKQRK